MKLDGNKLLDNLESLLKTQACAINAFKNVGKFGAANDWQMMHSQIEQVVLQIKSGDYTID